MVDMTSIVLGELLHGQQHLMATELAEQAPRLHHGQVSVPALQKALTRWETHGLEARIEPLVVLRLAESELLEKLRESKASGCLGEVLGPTAVLVKPGCGSRVRAALRELGILTDLPGEGE